LNHTLPPSLIRASHVFEVRFSRRETLCSAVLQVYGSGSLRFY
jgi:hypothetical protein